VSGGRASLVTGASAGIGAETAVALGHLGWPVALGARRMDRLEEVGARVEAAGGRAFVHPLDVSRPESIDAFWDAAEKELGPLDVVISNAGMSILNLLEQASPLDLSYEVAVNLVGPMLLARRAVPGMRERRRGDIVFVSSENAIHPRPYQPAYTAAKAGLEGLARVLEMELEGSGVRSTVVRLGPTGSEFGAKMEEETLHAALASWKYWGVQRKLHWMKAEDAARAIVRAVTTPVEESYTTLVEVMPGGRRKEP
jgi:NAD(P)-dependent dehydrogenase (short-subunit alcohol dehydrogenase family)